MIIYFYINFIKRWRSSRTIKWLCFEELELNVINCEYQYIIKFEISLTEDLENNIKNEYRKYLKRVENVNKF